MKKLLFTLILFAGMQTLSTAQFTVGAGAAYYFPGSSFGFQAKGLLGVSEKLDLSPSVGIFLGDHTPFVIDADIHYELLEIGEGFRVLPLAGLNFISVAGTTDLGINLGVSFRFDVSENTVYIEPKLTIISLGGMALSAGVLF